VWQGICIIQDKFIFIMNNQSNKQATHKDHRAYVNIQPEQWNYIYDRSYGVATEHSVIIGSKRRIAVHDNLAMESQYNALFYNVPSSNMFM
jgi:hypothetical protein